VDDLYFANEVSSENNDGLCTVLYSPARLSEEEIRLALRTARKNGGHHNAPLLVEDDEDFSYAEHATPVSTKAGYYRYECFGNG
jgi:hypothetical protein